MTPYDWQISLGQRAEFAQERLSSGIPAVAVSLESGLLCVSLRRQTPKVYDVYDRLLMSAMGVQSDVDALRVAAIEFCHQEGYRRSEDDVTILRVAAALAQSMRRAYSDLRSMPVLAQALLAEVGAKPEMDRYSILTYEGDFSELTDSAVLAGTVEAAEQLEKTLDGISASTKPEAAAKKLEAAIREVVGEAAESLKVDAALLDRSGGERAFKRLSG